MCSALGLPWAEASTVPSINHVKALTTESETTAPGEKRRFLGIREQRATHLAVMIMIGLSAYLPYLDRIPMPVLFGVFLFMGTAALNGLQFFDRLLLLFTPQEEQPDYDYLRKVSVGRVHLFTLAQSACFALLLIVKEVKITSAFFPACLAAMCGIRGLLDCIFTPVELRALDNPLPRFRKLVASKKQWVGNIEIAASGAIERTGTATTIVEDETDK